MVDVLASLNNDGSVVTGAQLFYEVLDAFDIRDAFGYTGGNVLPLLDAFANPPKGDHLPITVHMHANESCAGHSATGYARSSNHVGVCIVTSGPGITNCITPIKDAYADGAAVLFISGQVARTMAGKEAFQEVDAEGVTRPVTKWSHLVNSIETLPHSINKAFKMMLNGRPGPVHLDVPKDVFNSPLPIEYDPFISRRANAPPGALDNPLQCKYAKHYVEAAFATKFTTDTGLEIINASRKNAHQQNLNTEYVENHDAHLGSYFTLQPSPSAVKLGSSTHGNSRQEMHLTPVTSFTGVHRLSSHASRRESTNTHTPLRNAANASSFHSTEAEQNILSQLAQDVYPAEPAPLSFFDEKGSPKTADTNEPFPLGTSTSSRVVLTHPSTSSLSPEMIDHNSMDKFMGCGPDITLNTPKLVQLLKVAKRPVIHVGNGAKISANIIRSLAKHFHIPVTCTMHGLGIVSAHDPLMTHWIGMHGSHYANLAIQNCDLLIGFGARFDDRSIGSVDSFAPEARKAARECRGGIVHIDIDADSFGKSGIIAHLNIRADCGVVASELIQMAPRMEHTEWVDQCQAWKKEYALTLPESPDGMIKGPHLVDAVNRWVNKHDMTKETLITTGVGNHQMYTCQYFDYTSPGQLVSSGGLGTMGVGVPFSIGMSIAHPDSYILDFDGDGSFNMTSNDLATMSRYKNNKIKVFIFNDNHLSMVAMWQEFFMDNREFIVDSVNPDYCMLAKCHGLHSVLIQSMDELDEKVDEAMSHEGPTIIDCRMIKSHVFPMSIPGTSLSDQYLSREHMMQMGGKVGANISPG